MPGLSEEEQRRSAAAKRLEEQLHGCSLRDVEATAGSKIVDEALGISSLVGGLKHFYIFPYIGNSHHPN